MTPRAMPVLACVAALLAGCGDARAPRRAADPPPVSVVATPQTTVYRVLAPGEDHGPAAAPRVVLVPSSDPAIAQALTAGLRLALDAAAREGGPDLDLVVLDATSAWDSVAEGAVREALDGDAVALIAPPERRTAHLLVQLGTKVRLPVFSTSPSRSVVGPGSPWVVGVVPFAGTAAAGDGPPPPPAFDADAPAARSFATAFRHVHGRTPGPWDAAGYDAGRCVAEAVRRNGLHRAGLLGALVHGGPVAGAAGAVALGSGSMR
jgi:ABC-type branched-subunit amino acid transport system substrate-binding protein